MVVATKKNARPAPANMPDELTPQWEAVQEADARRQEVRSRIVDAVERIGDARRRLAEASGKARDDVAAELAGLRAETTVLPDEAEDAANAFAVALHHWGLAGLGIVEEIECRGRREARAFEDEAEIYRRKVAAREAATPEDLRAGRVSYEDIDGERQKLGHEALTKSVATANFQAVGRAEGALRRAQQEAQPLVRMLREAMKDGRRTSVFPLRGRPSASNGAFGTIDADGRLTGHEDWLRRQRQAAEQELAGAR